MVKTVGRAAQTRSPGEQRAQVGGDQTGLPVVRVDDVRPHVAARAEFERGSGQQREPHRVVRVVVVPDAVEAGTVVELGALDENRPRPVGQRVFDERDVEPPAAHGDGQALEDGAPVGAAIARQHERHVVPETRERERQRPRHVAQAARLRKRHRLRAHHQNPPRAHRHLAPDQSVYTVRRPARTSPRLSTTKLTKDTETGLRHACRRCGPSGFDRVAPPRGGGAWRPSAAPRE